MGLFFFILPLVMDDVLVNFDPGRASAMAEAFVDFAKGRQILFFTCHPSTRDMFLSVDPNLNVIEMPLAHMSHHPPAQTA